MLRLFKFLFRASAVAPARRGHGPSAKERWQILGLNGSMTGFAAQWDGLNQRLQAGHPMLDSRFVNGLLRYFGEGTESLCQLERDGCPVAMCILKRARPGVWASFLPAQAQVAPVLLEDSAPLFCLPSQLPGLVGQVDFLCQDPDFSPVLRCPNMPHRNTSHALTMSIRLAGDFASYWAGRSSNLRGVMRRRQNHLQKSGLEPRLICLESPGDMPAAIERFGKLESAGWKGRAGTAVSAGNAQGQFYGDILGKFAESGQARVYEYWLGNHLAAAQLAIISDRMMVLLKTSYDEGLGNFSPGRLLLQEVIRDGFCRLPGGVIEFYTHASTEQLAWATDQRWIEHISLYRNRAVQQLSAARRRTRRSVLAIRTLAHSLRTKAFARSIYRQDIRTNKQAAP